VLVVGCGGGGTAAPAEAQDGAPTPPAMPEGGDAPGSSSSAPGGPHLFFSDIVSGPVSGGQNGKGAFVTVYGNGFGAVQGSSTVTIGAGTADNYPRWSANKITFQLGAAARTGDVVVHVAQAASNALPFTVRSGNVFFVSSTGSDAADGSFAHPWATIPHAKNAIQPGDIAYIGTSAGDSVSQTTVDASSPYDCALGMSVNDGSNSGTAAMPKALVVYPGATALVGDPSTVKHGLLTPGIAGTFDYWVVAGFSLRGLNEGIDLESAPVGWRIIGNDVSCPNGTGLTGCVTGGPTHLAFYGNVVHDAAANIATAAISKYYHGVYWGSSHIDMGWNTVRDGKTCRAIQFHDTGGPNEFDLHVHDNFIHGTVCDGINFATVDPSQGVVEAYNNVIYDVGQGPDPADGSSDYAGIYVAGATEMGAPGSGVVQVYDNTLDGCGSWTSNPASGAFNNGGGNPGLTMNAVDNIVVTASPMQMYLAKDSATGLVTGSNNVFFGSGGAPPGLTASVSGDPAFAGAAAHDFHLTAASAAIGKGIAASAATDVDGNARPQGQSFDIGAYEFVR